MGRLVESFRLEYYQLVKEYLEQKEQIIPCYAGWASAQIAPDGYVWGCCIRAESVGGLRENGYDFGKVWFSTEADAFRRSVYNRECACPLANASYTNMLVSPRSPLARTGSFLRATGTILTLVPCASSPGSPPATRSGRSDRSSSACSGGAPGRRARREDRRRLERLPRPDGRDRPLLRGARPAGRPRRRARAAGKGGGDQHLSRGAAARHRRDARSRAPTSFRSRAPRSAIVAAFADPAVGMAGGRPVPQNEGRALLDRMARLMWHLHDRWRGGARSWGVRRASARSSSPPSTPRAPSTRASLEAEVRHAAAGSPTSARP